MKGGAQTARDDEDDRRIADELRRGGCPEDVISEVVDVQDGGVDDYEIWPENADVFRAFLFVGTQWRAATGMQVVWIGVDYMPVFKWLEKHPQQDEDDFWWAFQVLEREGLTLRNKKHADA
jgi:hypothetical protein